MKERMQALRAARSYRYNHELRPKVEDRLARAESELRSYLLREGVEELRLGAFQVSLHDDELVVTKARPEGWEQLEIAEMAEADAGGGDMV
jgi:hypothetical protein